MDMCVLDWLNHRHGRAIMKMKNFSRRRRRGIQLEICFATMMDGTDKKELDCCCSTVVLLRRNNRPEK
jgi:hypothetical protein